MGTQDGGHRDAAIDALADRDYELAGDQSTRAARSVLADPRPEQSPFAPDDRGWVGRGIQYFVVATVSYRVAGTDARATRRAGEAIAAAHDLKHGLTHPAQHACLDEFVADLTTAGGLQDIDESYATAAKSYRSAAGDVDALYELATSPLFMSALEPIQQVARGQAHGEIAIEWDDLHGGDPDAVSSFLAHRATYKQQRFPGLVQQAVSDGHLAAPRGTTEYSNANYRCPACGADDVNWSGSGVVCLRCSTPMEQK
jgi:hypothetical protein